MRILAFLLSGVFAVGADSSKFFPLEKGNWWLFEGLAPGTGEKFQTKITVEEKETLCGIEVTPLMFTKNKPAGYWGPAGNLNLRWFIADGRSKEGSGFLRAVGDKRYVRKETDPESAGIFSSFVWYLGQDGAAIPPYVIFPKNIVSGDYLTVSVQKYPEINEDRQDCGWIGDFASDESASWRVEYDFVNPDSSVSSDESVLKARFIEDFGGRGWIENWYFVEKIGPIMIEAIFQGESFGSKDLNSVMIRLKLIKAAIGHGSRE